MTLLLIPEFFGVSIEVYLIIIILCLPCFYFSRWALKKFISNNQTLRWATWLGTFLLAPIIYVFFALIFIFSINYYPSHDFDKLVWKNDVETRYEITENLIESELLIGRTKVEVKHLLGNDYQEIGSDIWSYYVGFRPQLFGIDPDYLYLEFKEGRVVSVSQHSS